MSHSNYKPGRILGSSLKQALVLGHFDLKCGLYALVKDNSKQLKKALFTHQNPQKQEDEIHNMAALSVGGYPHSARYDRNGGK